MKPCWLVYNTVNKISRGGQKPLKELLKPEKAPKTNFFYLGKRSPNAPFYERPWSICEIKFSGFRWLHISWFSGTGSWQSYFDLLYNRAQKWRQTKTVLYCKLNFLTIIIGFHLIKFIFELLNTQGILLIKRKNELIVIHFTIV